MKLSEIVNVLEASILTGEDQLDKCLDRGGGSDLMSDILAGLSEEFSHKEQGFLLET